MSPDEDADRFQKVFNHIFDGIFGINPRDPGHQPFVPILLPRRVNNCVLLPNYSENLAIPGKYGMLIMRRKAGGGYEMSS